MLVFLLENAARPFTMYGHNASQVSTKKTDLVIFWWDRQYFCLIIKQKAGWLIGMPLKLSNTDCLQNGSNSDQTFPCYIRPSAKEYILLLLVSPAHNYFARALKYIRRRNIGRAAPYSGVAPSVVVMRMRQYALQLGPGPGVKFTPSNDTAAAIKEAERPVIESPHDREACLFQLRLRDRERARQRHCCC